MKIISGLKVVPLLVWTALIVAMGFELLHRQYSSGGYGHTIVGAILGPAAFPLFCFAEIWILTIFALMWWHRRDFIRADDRRIIVGWISIAFADVREVVLRTDMFGINRVAVVRNNGRATSIQGYFLSHPTGPTIAQLRELLHQDRPA